MPAVTATEAPAPALTPRQIAIQAQREITLSKYSQAQQAAALRLFICARFQLDTSGGATVARLLLGLYNGTRFPFDLTDLRRLDSDLWVDSMTVIHMDSRSRWCEIHVLLDAVLAVPYGKSTGHTMELWAHSLRLKGKCNKEAIPQLKVGAA